MKESAIRDEVIQKLNEFEMMQDIHPSSGWNESLNNRLASGKTGSTSNHISARLTIPVLFIILINLVLFLNTIISSSRQVSHKDKELLVISEELLINPISIKN
jgi:hypothetical protein